MIGVAFFSINIFSFKVYARDSVLGWFTQTKSVGFCCVALSGLHADVIVLFPAVVE